MKQTSLPYCTAKSQHVQLGPSYYPLTNAKQPHQTSNYCDLPPAEMKLVIEDLDLGPNVNVLSRRIKKVAVLNLYVRQNQRRASPRPHTEHGYWRDS